ncbi:hypothetical protein CPC08DRAFT_796076 [Agrocybe pediades]|nr:hypothetical protein CPC08DRAFT_796076 [Agrocybe pediades]
MQPNITKDEPPELWVRAMRASKDKPIDKSNGRANLINGRFYYSPNCSRPLKDEALLIEPVDPSKSSVDVIREPTEWSPEQAYLSFMEMGSVMDGPMSWILRARKRYGKGKKKSVRMASEDVLRWNRLQFDLKTVSAMLLQLSGAPCEPPFIESVLQCNGSYEEPEALSDSIEQSREWFSYWIGRTAYAIAVCESIEELECTNENASADILPTRWFRTMTEEGWYQGFISSIRSACRKKDVRSSENTLTNCPPDPSRVGVIHQEIPFMVQSTLCSSRCLRELQSLQSCKSLRNALGRK